MKKNKNKNFKLNDYVINEKKNSVIYAENFHGELILGWSRCGESDEFDIEKGKQIAYYRVQLGKRLRNIELMREYKKMQQLSIKFVEDHEHHVPHKLFMRSIHEAKRLIDIEQGHINNIRQKLAELTA